LRGYRSAGVRIPLDHVVFRVSDLDRAADFYARVLGAETLQLEHGRLGLRFAAQQLNVHGPGSTPHPVAGNPMQPGGFDACFVWPGPIEEAIAHLERCGVAVELGPVPRTGARGEAESVYFRDPDGSLLELMSYAKLDELSDEADPIELFSRWLAEARAARITNAEAAVVATSTSDGTPSARFVLVRDADERGFTFFTNTTSRKADELAENPRAALALYWVDLGRQVRIEGRVEPTSREETEAYFRTRPRGSKIGAWASPQSQPIPSREVLEHRVAELEARYPGDDVPLPPHWGGYRVAPEAIEFWVHRDSRLHDRLRFTAQAGGGWRSERLAP
jgi:pyridoxamine 5'-phosphate oxidase